MIPASRLFGPAAIAGQLQAVLKRREPPSFFVGVFAAICFAVQCAGLAFAVQRVGCDFENNPVPQAAACRGEAFIAAMAVPGVSSYETWDKMVEVVAAVLVWSISLAICLPMIAG